MPSSNELTPETPLWFVMTHLEMGRLERNLQDENARRLVQNKPLIEYFIPYKFVKERIAKEKVIAGVESSYELRYFIFIKATEKEMSALLDHDWNRFSRVRLQHYVGKDNKRVSVPDVMMRRFFNECVNQRGHYELWPPIWDIEKNDKVIIKQGPFAGETAYVIKVSHKRGRLDLTLGIPFAERILTIVKENVTRRQIIILNKDLANGLRDDFIDYTQDNLITILNRRANPQKRTQESDRKDAVMLDRLYRYHYYEIGGVTARRHFLALMLICARLRRDKEGQEKLRAQVQEELRMINAQGDARAATDTRAYLWIALYISTHNPEYRNAAKQYMQEHNPKSVKLRRFIALIREKNNF